MLRCGWGKLGLLSSLLSVAAATGGWPRILRPEPAAVTAVKLTTLSRQRGQSASKKRPTLHEPSSPHCRMLWCRV